MIRDSIVQDLNELLDTDGMDDSTYNGLQIEGNSQITKIGFAVDSCLPVFEEAARQQCDMLVVHHGLIWGGWKKVTGVEKQKLQLLMDNGINLYVSHLPLDKHPQYGNNSRIISNLGAQLSDPILDVAYIAEWPDPVTYTELKEKLSTHVGFIGEMHYGPEKIDRMAVSSGGFRAGWLATLHQEGIHTLITGEGSAASLFYYPAQELGMNILFAGHYATETFGVKALQEYIQQQYKTIDTVFIDMETGW